METHTHRGPSLLIRLKWRIEWAAQSTAEKLIVLLPGTWAFRLGQVLGQALWYLMPYRRRIVIKNLRLVFAGEYSLAQIEQLAQKSFARSLANLISAIHTAHLPPAVLESRVMVENPEVLEAAVQGGKGCLLLPPHMGNWEILSRIKHLYPEGTAQGALYRPLNNPYLDARLVASRQSEGTRMFSKRDSLLAITSFLREGGIIGVLADQRAGYQGVLTNFFGRLTRVSPLPQLLMRRCKVSGMTVSIRTTTPGRWALKYHPIAEPRDTEAFVDALECAMRESLVDVFWFQDRWQCNLRKGSVLRDWLGEEPLVSIKSPHRVLVWLVDASTSCILPEHWRHPDVEFEFMLGETQQIPSWAPASSRIHRIAPALGGQALRAELRRIDRAKAVPLDYVLHDHAQSLLQRACAREGLKSIPISFT